MERSLLVGCGKSELDENQDMTVEAREDFRSGMAFTGLWGGREGMGLTGRAESADEMLRGSIPMIVASEVILDDDEEEEKSEQQPQLRTLKEIVLQDPCEILLPSWSAAVSPRTNEEVLHSPELMEKLSLVYPSNPPAETRSLFGEDDIWKFPSDSSSSHKSLKPFSFGRAFEQTLANSQDAEVAKMPEEEIDTPAKKKKRQRGKRGGRRVNKKKKKDAKESAAATADVIAEQPSVQTRAEIANGSNEAALVEIIEEEKEDEAKEEEDELGKTIKKSARGKRGGRKVNRRKDKDEIASDFSLEKTSENTEEEEQDVPDKPASEETPKKKKRQRGKRAGRKLQMRKLKRTAEIFKAWKQLTNKADLIQMTMHVA